MGFKGIYENKSSASRVGILFFLIFVSVILHTLLAVALVALFADNGMAVIQNQDLSNQTSINYLKLMQLFSGIGLFITPTLLYAYLTNFDFKFTKLSRQNTILVIAIMMLIPPFIGLLLEWNMMISFPEWLLQFDINSEAFVIAFLQMDTIWDLFYTILVIAVVPAIGEELLFRGYLQQKFGSWLRNPHTAILITAFLFSAIHFHFQGIIPRLVLGVLLGYLFYWSNSLWLPILAHFVNNAQAVIFSYPLFKVDSGAYSMLSEAKISPMVALFSLASVVLLLYILRQNTRIKKG
ncbi:CPBP family intramembrane metalloprotease [Flavobacteriales bacterium]|nr:CPBP family intramembrane metalloprotease [Flavobacteriales bacterium]